MEGIHLSSWRIRTNLILRVINIASVLQRNGKDMQHTLFEQFKSEISQLASSIFSIESNNHSTQVFVFDKGKCPPNVIANHSFLISFTHYFRGTHKDNLRDVAIHGIDKPNQRYNYMAVEGMEKAVEYGDEGGLHPILVYDRNLLTFSLGKKEENYPKNIFQYEIEYDGELYDSAIPPEKFNPGYDFVYARTYIDSKNIHPTIILLFVDDVAADHTSLFKI